MVQKFLSSAYLTHYWFQAFGCVLAYDWHSSGVTTVVTGILKGAFSPEEHGIAVCGGKGKTSKKTPSDIAVQGKNSVSQKKQFNTLTYNSKMAAKLTTPQSKRDTNFTIMRFW